MTVLGKNLITTPRWDNSSRPNNWFGYEPNFGAIGRRTPAKLTADAAANPIDGTAGYRTGAAVTADGALVLNVGTLVPGDYYLWLRVARATAGAYRYGFAPYLADETGKLLTDTNAGNWAGADDDALEALVRYQTRVDSNYVELSDTFTIPDTTGWGYVDIMSGATEYLPAPGSVQWAIYVYGPKINATYIGGARLDDYLSTGPEDLAVGYLDGTMTADDLEYSWSGEPFESISIADDGQVPVTVIEPPAVVFSDDPARYVLPAVDGVEWTVDGETVQAGSHDVTIGDEPVTVSVLPTPAAGYVFDPPAQAATYTWQPVDPGPDPDPDPEPDTENGAADAVALMRRMLGADVTLDEMDAAYSMVRLFVQEYTRGKGFNAHGRPSPGLLAVIVAGAVRLVNNPEQAELYSLDGVTIRPAVFKGYTIAEQFVLNNYRRRFA